MFSLKRLDDLIRVISDWSIFKNFRFIERFLKFCLVGTVNTAIDFSIFFGLTRSLVFFARHYLTANLLAFIMANLFSFIANKHWTFGNQSPAYFSQYYKFLTVSLIALAAVQLTLYLLITGLGVWDVMAKILALVISVTIGFFGSRFWAFR